MNRSRRKKQTHPSAQNVFDTDENMYTHLGEKLENIHRGKEKPRKQHLENEATNSQLFMIEYKKKNPQRKDQHIPWSILQCCQRERSLPRLWRTITYRQQP